MKLSSALAPITPYLIVLRATHLIIYLGVLALLYWAAKKLFTWAIPRVDELIAISNTLKEEYATIRRSIIHVQR